MMKALMFFGVLMSSSLTLAGSFDLFLPGLAHEYYFMKTDRVRELDHEIRVQELGLLGQWTSPDAIATYNDILNTISLNKNHLNGNVIKPVSEILGKNIDYSKISTIFHEMGHAEMDVFIENSVTPEDEMINLHYVGVMKDFYRDHFPGFSPHMVFQEHFGYYRGELIEFFAGEISTVLMNNGYNRFKNSCYLTPQLRKKLSDGTTLEEFRKVMLDSEGDFYRNQVGPRFIFVKGKDLDLSSVPKREIQLTHQLFWSYHQTFYGFPINRKDLVNRMNSSGAIRRNISECRTKLWNDNHRRR